MKVMLSPGTASTSTLAPLSAMRRMTGVNSFTAQGVNSLPTVLPPCPPMICSAVSNIFCGQT